jgi:biotin carboxyl carrier protein
MAIHKVSAPLAGVFYRRPSPEEEPFKSEGDVISVGDTVGVIEAMKSFFPLEVETRGRLVRFLVTDGTEIEAGEILVEIEA